MNQSQYITLSGLVFAIVGLLHLLRVVKDWPLTVGPWEIPLFLSILAILLAGFLAWSAWQLRR